MLFGEPFRMGFFPQTAYPNDLLPIDRFTEMADPDAINLTTLINKQQAASIALSVVGCAST
jgi:hypothetical protein